MSTRTEQKIARLERKLGELRKRAGGRSVFEWWRRPDGTGAYHERVGPNIKTTSQHTYSRARDAARQATKDARRVGARVVEIDPPKRRKP